jgi:death on curing protein
VSQSPEVFGVSVKAVQSVDVIEFLWASLALFDDDAGQPDMAMIYRPPLRPDLHTVAEARERILQRLAETPDGAVLDRFLPDMPASAEGETYSQLRRRSAWSGTFTASLELARQGKVVLAQGEAFAPIHLSSCSDRETWPGLGRPQNLANYGNPAPDVADLAGSYAMSLAKAHAFVDGNKRPAWATSRAFLRLNGYTVQFEKMSSVLLMVDAADDKIDETALASWFRARLIRLSKG